MGLLMAGTKFQGEFEERIKKYFKSNRRIPWTSNSFIDEMHMIVSGAGQSGGGGMDASNLLKPALARGQLALYWRNNSQRI